MESKLVITDVHEDINGEHPCDLIGMLTVGHPESLTNRELHRIKTLTGLVASRLFDAINEGDMDAELGVAAVVLDRNGKVFQDDWLWDAPMGSGMRFEVDASEEEEDVPPPSDVPVNTPTGASETNGGVSSRPESESPAKDQSGTGSQPSDTSAISGHAI